MNRHCGRREITGSRREWLAKMGGGLGAIALTELMAREGSSAMADVLTDKRERGPWKNFTTYREPSG